MGKKVAVMIDGEIQVHGSACGMPSDYDTFCGIDANDPEIGSFPAILPRGALIDCPECRQIWEASKAFTAKDFE